MKTQMTFSNETEKIKAQLKVLQSKLSFLEELEKTKSPVEEAFKDWWGQYPETGTWDGFDEKRWQGFQAGYEFACAISTAKAVMEKVQVVSSTKPQTLTDLIYDWWERVFGDTDDTETCIKNLVDEISLWLPTEHETNSYKWNECIRMIREKLR